MTRPQAQPATSDVDQDDSALTAREKEILLFEQKWFRYPGNKESRIREHWDLSTTQYYQLLNTLIDKPAALAWDPATVNRLLTLRQTNRVTKVAS